MRPMAVLVFALVRVDVRRQRPGGPERREHAERVPARDARDQACRQWGKPFSLHPGLLFLFVQHATRVRAMSCRWETIHDPGRRMRFTLRGPWSEIRACLAPGLAACRRVFLGLGLHAEKRGLAPPDAGCLLTWGWCRNPWRPPVRRGLSPTRFSALWSAPAPDSRRQAAAETQRPRVRR